MLFRKHSQQPTLQVVTTQAATQEVRTFVGISCGLLLLIFANLIQGQALNGDRLTLQVVTQCLLDLYGKSIFYLLFDKMIGYGNEDVLILEGK